MKTYKEILLREHDFRFMDKINWPAHLGFSLAAIQLGMFLFGAEKIYGNKIATIYKTNYVVATNYVAQNWEINKFMTTNFAPQTAYLTNIIISNLISDNLIIKGNTLYITNSYNLTNTLQYLYYTNKL